MVSTTAKIKARYWIVKASKLAKSVKFKRAFCHEMARRVKTQQMADLLSVRLAPLTPPFQYTACDYFRPFKVKVGRNETAKHYRVIFTCLNTRAIHLETAVDYSTMEFMEVLRRFFSIRGYPAVMRSGNGSQMVGAARELREMVRGFEEDQLREFCAEKGIEWKFTTPASPHQNGCAEALVKGARWGARFGAIKIAVIYPAEGYD